MKPQLTTHEEKIISNIGIYKGDILRSLILIYKKQNKKYNLTALTQLSRKSLTALKQQVKNQSGDKY